MLLHINMITVCESADCGMYIYDRARVRVSPSQTSRQAHVYICIILQICYLCPIVCIMQYEIAKLCAVFSLGK